MSCAVRSGREILRGESTITEFGHEVILGQAQFLEVRAGPLRLFALQVRPDIDPVPSLSPDDFAYEERREAILIQTHDESFGTSEIPERSHVDAVADGW